MNILVLSNLYPRPNDPSYGIFVHRQVKHLQKLGLYVTVLSCVPWSPRILQFHAKWRDYGLAPDKTTWEEIPVYYPRYLRLPGAWYRFFSGIAAYGGMLPVALELCSKHRFDIIHSNTLLPDGLAGVYLGQKLGLPTVCTVHGSDILVYPRENRLNLHGSRTAIYQTHQVVTVSQALRRAVENLAVPRRTIRVVYYGVDAERFQEPGPVFTEQGKEVAPAKPYILFVGRDIHIKGLKDLLLAFGKLIDRIQHNLVVIGPTPGEVRKLDPELCAVLGDRLIIPGRLAPDEIPVHMKNCELFVLPSYSEGLPNVVLEAMACGKPVIASEIMGIPEEVSNGITGLLIRPGDVSGIAEAIYSLANNPARAREMGKQGRERVAKEFTWERNASEMVSIYRETIDAGSVA